VSASRLLGLQRCTTTLGASYIFFSLIVIWMLYFWWICHQDPVFFLSLDLICWWGFQLRLFLKSDFLSVLISKILLLFIVDFLRQSH
jgi:hypothetical protein